MQASSRSRPQPRAPFSTSPVDHAVQPLAAPLAPRARSGPARHSPVSSDDERHDAVTMHVSSRAQPPRRRVDLSPWEIPPAPPGEDIARLLAHLQTLNLKYAPLFDAYCVRYRGQGFARDRQDRLAIDSEIARLEDRMVAIFKARQETVARCVRAGCDAAGLAPLNRPDFRAPSTWPVAGARVQAQRPAALNLKLLPRLQDIVLEEDEGGDEPLSRQELLVRLKAVEEAYDPLYRDYVQLMWAVEEGKDDNARTRMDALRPRVQKCCKDKARLRWRLQEAGVAPWDLPQGRPLLFPGV